MSQGILGMVLGWDMAVWMASFYWHRRAALIAEVRPEVHPIHPVQSTYGFWTFESVYTYFRSIWASQLQSMAVWSLLIFYYHYINKNSFQKENLHYEIVAFLCYTWSKNLNFSWQEMHISLFFLEKKEWNLKCFHSFREWKVKSKCLEIEIESEKWNENASRSRSRSEISREFSRNSWESRNPENFKLLVQMLFIYSRIRE